MPRILLLATTTGYQTRAFGDAAARLGADLVFATDRCHMLEDPWQDGAIPILFEAGVPKNSRSKEGAFKYLNAMLQPPAQQAFAEKMGYLPTVENAPLTLVTIIQALGQANVRSPNAGSASWLAPAAASDRWKRRWSTTWRVITVPR